MDASSVPHLPTRPDLVDLRTMTSRWRLASDEEHLPIIPGRRGHVAAHDRTMLSVHIAGRRHLLALLRALPPGWRRHQIGDAEVNLLAPLGDLDLAARVVKAYRRRRLSPEQRADLVRRLRRPPQNRGSAAQDGPPAAPTRV